MNTEPEALFADAIAAIEALSADSTDAAGLLENLAEIDRQVDRLIATHPLAASDLLTKLAKSGDEQTRELVSGNSNSPFRALLDLAVYHPLVVLKKPSFEVVLPENLDRLQGLSEDGLGILLELPECPVSIIDWARQFRPESRYVRVGIARNPGVPLAVLEEILNAVEIIHAEVSPSEGML